MTHFKGLRVTFWSLGEEGWEGMKTSRGREGMRKGKREREGGRERERGRKRERERKEERERESTSNLMSGSKRPCSRQ